MYENTVLKISHVERSTRLLGPFDRFVIWVHGCCFDCAGCLAENTKNGSYQELSAPRLAREILDSGCEGITISGGEPFLQAPALVCLIEAVRRERDVGVIVYSGFTLEELRADEEKAPLLYVIDVLIDGRYVQELDVGRPYIGSSNQRIHYLSPRYAEVGPAYYVPAGKRRAEIKFTNDQVVLIGVPSKNVLRIWEDVKEKSGGIEYVF